MPAEGGHKRRQGCTREGQLDWLEPQRTSERWGVIEPSFSPDISKYTRNQNGGHFVCAHLDLVKASPALSQQSFGIMVLLRCVQHSATRGIISDRSGTLLLVVVFVGLEQVCSCVGVFSLSCVFAPKKNPGARESRAPTTGYR